MINRYKSALITGAASGIGYSILKKLSKHKLKIYDKILKDKNLIRIINKDKKNFQNNINFSLINKIGSSIFYKKLDKNKVYKILQNI